MPPKSEKQRRFMAAVANNPKFAKKVGVPQNVGEEMMKKYQEGGPTTSMRPRMRPKDMMGSASAPKRSIRARRRPEDMETDMEPDMSVDTAVGRSNRAAERDAYDMRTLGPESGMKMGGKVGMHKMPDGTMMKDSAHKMKEGGKVRGYGKARGGKACKMM